MKKKENDRMSLREQAAISRRAVRTLWSLNPPYTVCLFVRPLLETLGAYIPVYFSAKLVDALIARESVPVLVRYVIYAVLPVFLFALIQAFCSAVQSTESFLTFIREDWKFSDKAMELPYEKLEDPETERLKMRIRQESQTGMNLYYVIMTAGRFIHSISSILASAALTASFFGQPGIPLWQKTALLAGLAVSIVVSVKTTRRAMRCYEEELGDVTFTDVNVYFDALEQYGCNYGGGKDIRLYGMEEIVAGQAFRYEAELNRRLHRVSKRRAAINIPNLLVVHLFRFGCYAVLIASALNGGISAGSIAKYAACIAMMLAAFTEFAATLERYFENLPYLKRYFSYFDIPNDMVKGSLTVEKRDDNEYNVEFRDVSFKYPNTEIWALRHVSLKFRIGEKLAIVGENGSGKTTFIKLLCRLYDPTEGEILLNGVNIQKYDYDEYMSIFSVVFQDFTLFPFRLGEVVASKRDFDSARVRECLEKATFDTRLETLPHGVDTYIGRQFDRDGVEFSGGEGQKIALARALYKDSPFILLDEPTAALDPVSEYEVYSNFNAISGDKTTVYISHRLASCRFCDKIAVFDRGQIVQTGGHEELLSAEGGKYAELWSAQAQFYTEE